MPNDNQFDIRSIDQLLALLDGGAFETACTEAAELASAETGLPLFVGEPESRKA